MIELKINSFIIFINISMIELKNVKFILIIYEYFDNRKIKINKIKSIIDNCENVIKYKKTFNFFAI